MVIINEEWRSINSYINYQVSNVGRVRNSKTGRILKPKLGSNGYFTVGLSKNGGVKTHMIHQLVAREFLENPNGKPCIDHIDGNKTNNSLENLRLCSYSQNNRNRNKRENASSIYKGVCWDRSLGKWKAQIQINSRRESLGLFTNEKEAAQAYDEKAKELFKEFAKLNIIEND